MCGNGLKRVYMQKKTNPFPQSLALITLRKQAFETLKEYDKMLVSRMFFFYQNVFFPPRQKFHFLSLIQDLEYFFMCKIIQWFEYLLVQNFVILESVHPFQNELLFFHACSESI